MAIIEPMSTKKGAWVKPGSAATGMFPGSYKGYLYLRNAPDKYAKTVQQRKIGAVAQYCKKNRGNKKQYECVIDTFRDKALVDRIAAGQA